ncbi:nuclear transport factor 2 family protein [Aureisphaera galaxeae]|uniref:nuclear transport factor 2 family protein n=1 Tax=Aureisphaera galaxeae TaxID=1538023 RepID=UPI00234FE9EA|nr:nuclear transport factor 2 family protein [Aureisphaera galaxeae]MDC8002448.1 nuclear transport factor 2 family protein [Aureisphaera galaxeae]
MKKILLLFTLVSFPLMSQNITNADLAKEVDQQVWEPFKQSYKSGDAVTFNSIHTDDVIRITGRGIQKGQEYKDSNTQWLSKPDRKARTIDFVFEHRIYAEDTAYEIGYYKIVYGADEAKANYARFTVVLKKENGTWRIAQDWDTDEINGRKVTAEDFKRLRKN